MLKLFEEIEVKFSNIEVNIQKKIYNAYRLCNEESEFLKGKYKIDNLFEKYTNGLNNIRQELLDQIKLNLSLELSKVNEIVSSNDQTNMTKLLNKLNKRHHLQFKVKKLNPKETCIQRLINKQFKNKWNIFGF
jgi:hypothetical protein